MEDLEIDEFEQTRSKIRFFRDFLPRGMTTKMSVTDRRKSTKVPLPTKVNKPVEQDCERVSPKKIEQGQPGASGFDSSRDYWQTHVSKSRQHHTEEYLNWLLVDNFDKVQERFKTSSKIERRRI